MARKTRSEIERLEYRVTRLLKEAELIGKTAEGVWTEDMVQEAEHAITTALSEAFTAIRSGQRPADTGFRFSKKLRTKKVA